MSIIDPRGFTDVREWADFMRPLLEEQVFTYPRLDDPLEWQTWADAVFKGSSFLGQDSPDPFQYDNWRDWAERLFATIDFSG